jgi:hypothetical protein
VIRIPESVITIGRNQRSRCPGIRSIRQRASSRGSTIRGGGIRRWVTAHPLSTSVGRMRVTCMPCEFVISDIQWASAADLQCPIHETTASMCASLTPSGAPWSVRSQLSIPSVHGDPHCPKPSGTWWSPMPAPCSASRSHGRRCATRRVVCQTGSAGGWLEPFVRQHLEDAGPEDSSRGDARVRRAQFAKAQPRSARGCGSWRSCGRANGRAPTSSLDAGKRTPAPTATTAHSCGLQHKRQPVHETGQV